VITIAFARRLVAADGFFAIEEPDRLLIYDGDPDAPEGWRIVGRTMVWRKADERGQVRLEEIQRILSRVTFREGWRWPDAGEDGSGVGLLMGGARK
jgi:hypothetical protein